MIPSPPTSTMLPLTLARAAAWTLLLAGWVGLGSLAIVLAPRVFDAFALIALWLLGLGIAALVATRDSLRGTTRGMALVASAALAAVALAASTRGGGLAALLLALPAWAALTALASGVVRRLRLAQSEKPGPPIGAAGFGAVCAALSLGDPGDAQSLTIRLGVLVLLAAITLALLQRGTHEPAAGGRCRAGLFDCSLPAWPVGSWHDIRQWPALLAGLAMLPMMAALPLMVAWCRAQAVAPQAMVFLHLGAMFAPAWVLRHAIARWSAMTLSTVCAGCLAAGAVAAVALPEPWNLLGLACAHGTAWGVAWSGQLWSPQRRGRQGASPWRAALGYAALTLAFGAAVAWRGEIGVLATQCALAVAAVAAWLAAAGTPWARSAWRAVRQAWNGGPMGRWHGR